MATFRPSRREWIASPNKRRRSDCLKKASQGSFRRAQHSECTDIGGTRRLVCLSHTLLPQLLWHTGTQTWMVSINPLVDVL